VRGNTPEVYTLSPLKILWDFGVVCLNLPNVCSNIDSGRLKASIKTHREYVKHVKTIIKEKQNKADENLCPKCGKQMILRTAKSGTNQGGQFWGCSGFPKCRAVKQALWQILPN
jgi:predicted RNA-binding Zn-ribbon protein involved in translation (DUF1610 family)